LAKSGRRAMSSSIGKGKSLAVPTTKRNEQVAMMRGGVSGAATIFQNRGNDRVDTRRKAL
jgi:hypothetical protein